MNTLAHLGLIVPPADGAVPPEGAALYAGRAQFSARGLGLAEISNRGYNAVIDRVAELARELADAGALALSLMGTSLSFYRGGRANEDLKRTMAQASGLACTTMSDAVVNGLRRMNAQRVAVATAYIDEVNHQLDAFLRESGFSPTVVRGLSITDVQAVADVPPAVLADLCREVYRAQPGADAILISCGGLRTLAATQLVEAELGVPVVSSSPAGFWDLMCTAGLPAHSQGHGRLFELPTASSSG
ncbi:aspartate/glutamate racemase family protein [Ottowia thiooxydans]|uniref:Arylmalonate decarboxylase n=1 Tax=Ottowia thiooxydans TaxID=219182 RepID=A0ABV2Q9C1_9BURK